MNNILKNKIKINHPKTIRVKTQNPSGQQEPALQWRAFLIGPAAFIIDYPLMLNRGKFTNALTSASQVLPQRRTLLLMICQDYPL
jgi:hypothetical protein